MDVSVVGCVWILLCICFVFNNIECWKFESTVIIQFQRRMMNQTPYPWM